MAYTTINKGSNYFNTKLYTGNGTTQSVTGVGFQPDWSWLKCRSIAYNHRLYDSVRGALKNLQSNSTSAEATADNGLSAFNSDGFTVTQGGDAYNQSGETYVSWNWLAANGTASNTNGSITSTVSANTTSGFSIVSYTGTGSNATVGHGLGVAPSMIIVKSRSSTDWWLCYHKTLGATKYLALQRTDASVTQSNIWNDTAPDSDVFTVGTNSGTNGSGNSMIAYCFAEKKGFSKFGSWVGNGSTDGTFVYTGFKPSFVMFKSSSNTSSWGIVDNKRDLYNLGGIALIANGSDAEFTPASSGYAMDFLSNGIKLRGGTSQPNTSGQTYIYMAFAENPFVGSDGTPTTAR